MGLNLNLFSDFLCVIRFLPFLLGHKNVRISRKKSSRIFRSSVDIMLIKQAASPDNKQTINLTQSILHGHNCFCNIISPALNCLVPCLSSYVNLSLAQRSSSVYHFSEARLGPVPAPVLLGGKGVKKEKFSLI